jgi:hypothetical protein
MIPFTLATNKDHHDKQNKPDSDRQILSLFLSYVESQKKNQKYL